MSITLTLNQCTSGSLKHFHVNLISMKPSLKGLHWMATREYFSNNWPFLQPLLNLNLIHNLLKTHYFNNFHAILSKRASLIKAHSLNSRALSSFSPTQHFYLLHPQSCHYNCIRNINKDNHPRWQRLHDKHSKNDIMIGIFNIVQHVMVEDKIKE